jgi:acyl-CoA thioesterase FadM
LLDLDIRRLDAAQVPSHHRQFQDLDSDGVVVHAALPHLAKAACSQVLEHPDVLQLHDVDIVQIWQLVCLLVCLL